MNDRVFIDTNIVVYAHTDQHLKVRTMTHSEIIEETRQAGALFAEAHGHDIHRICEALRDIELQHWGKTQQQTLEKPLQGFGELAAQALKNFRNGKTTTELPEL